MTTRTSYPRIRTLACFAAVLLSACDSPSSSGDPTPSVSFRYSGVLSGRFSVTAPRPAPGALTESFVEGSLPAAGEFFVRSFSMHGGGIADAVLIDGPTTPGSYAIGSCTPLCVSVSGGFDVAVGPDARVGEYVFDITQGTMTIDPPRGAGRVRGRFSGKANVYVFTSNFYFDPVGEITVTDGSFETDLIAR
jgi:hypothetical protein